MFDRTPRPSASWAARLLGGVALVAGLTFSAQAFAQSAVAPPGSDGVSEAERDASERGRAESRWSLYFDLQGGPAHLSDVPAIAGMAGGGVRWLGSESWAVGAGAEFGIAYAKGILGSHQYHYFFALPRVSAIAFLDAEKFYRLEALLGAGPMHLSVTGAESNPSETVVSYVAGAGFAAGWFHMEAEYFGHRADVCERLGDPGAETTACYPTDLGVAVLAGLRIPLSL